MNKRIARQLAGLYPAEWRTRYGEEFQSFLETHPSNLRTIVNVGIAAIRERVLYLGRLSMDQRQDSLVLMLYACLAAFVAGVNFYWTVDDTPLAAAMHSHAALLTSWNLVRGGSIMALAACAIVGIPVLLNIVRTAVASRQWAVIYRLVVPVCVPLLTLVWIVAAGRLSGGHWVPTPWDVTGDWTAPPNWPTLATRWALSTVTFVLMTAGTIVIAISIRQAIRDSNLSTLRGFWFVAPSMLLGTAVVVMTVGVLAWGWFVQQYAASDFHVRNGGLFSSTNFASWLVSCVGFLAATLIAVKSTRSAVSLKTE